MKGVIVNFRRGRTTQRDNQMVIQAEKISDRKKAESLIGKTVTFTTESGKKQIKGKVSAAHGKKGAVRATFETGMPGQAIGQQVSIE
ncbi:50S ribosomal protein L35ae [Candidatus Woesearchaeota archaeon]|nr:50S ribosomal protein L35ae [Candidatus Woesearchaeota archaeon]